MLACVYKERMRNMSTFITITGFFYDMKTNELDPDQIVILRKEPTNEYDKEAIMVLKEDLTKIGYVANSWKTQAKGTYSAGRLYDKMDNESRAKICFVSNEMVIAQFLEEDQD